MLDLKIQCGNKQYRYLLFFAGWFRSAARTPVAPRVQAIRPSRWWMGIAEGYTGIIAQATRKIPIAIYIGDRDPLNPIGFVRNTRDLLLQQGFTVRYVEIQGHDHNYYAVCEQVNADAWMFLKSQRLPAARAASQY